MEAASSLGIDGDDEIDRDDDDDEGSKGDQMGMSLRECAATPCA